MDSNEPEFIFQPECCRCKKPLRYLGESRMMDKMEKGLAASLTLADKSQLRLYTCDICRKVEFYLP